MRSRDNYRSSALVLCAVAMSFTPRPSKTIPAARSMNVLLPMYTRRGAAVERSVATMDYQDVSSAKTIATSVAARCTERELGKNAAKTLA